MSIYSVLVKAYAKLCNSFLWPVSRKIAKRSPSVESDYRKAAFPFSYEEYISMALFTTVFVAFETFAFSSTVVFLFEYNAPTAPPAAFPAPAAASQTSPGMEFEIISEHQVMLSNSTVTISVTSNTSSTSCELQLNGVTYDMPLQKPERVCFNVSSKEGGLAEYCLSPVSISQDSYNYSYSLANPQPGQYNYSVSCSKPSFYRNGSFQVFASASPIKVSADHYPFNLLIIRDSSEVGSAHILSESSVLVPDGISKLKAVYEGAESEINVSVPAVKSVHFAFQFGSVQLTAPASGVIEFRKGNYSIEKEFNGSLEQELGTGHWEYSMKSQGYADASGSFEVAAGSATQLSVFMLRKTMLQIATEPEKPATNAKTYFIVNYTDSFGRPLAGFKANVTVDGQQAAEESLGLYSYFFNSSSEGTHTVVVRASRDFYEDQLKVISLNVVFNQERQDSLKMGIRVTMTLLLAFVTGFIFMLYPSQRASSRESSIDSTLPFVLSHMSSMAKSGISVSEIIRLMANYCAYDELRKEFSKMLKSMEILGYDLIKAIKTTAENTPSKKFSDILSSLATTIHSGGNISSFLKDRADSTRLDLTISAKEKTSAMALLGEIYIIMFVAVPIFVAVMLIAMEFVSAGALPISPIMALKLSAYVFIPVMTFVFIVYLMKELNAGI
ncbi:MAG: type II secretion system F family protein [archaeon]